MARAGWIRWRETKPPLTRPSAKNPIAARLVLDDGSGIDLTEAGTKKSLAIWLVRSEASNGSTTRKGKQM